jgi:hypothetical protein
MTEQELELLAAPATKALVQHYHDADPAQVALELHALKNPAARVVAEQLACRRRAAHKLPRLSAGGMYFESTALQQASSESTALFKTSILTGRCIDITGGLGIDTLLAMPPRSAPHYCEESVVLAKLFALNCQILNRPDIHIHPQDGLEVIRQAAPGSFDWIYLDPARRDSQRRYIDLRSCRPDIVTHLPLLLSRADSVLVKIAPAYEPLEAARQLPQLTQCIFVSSGGECREQLLICQREPGNAQPVRTVAVCVDKQGGVRARFEGPLSGELHRHPIAPRIGSVVLDPDGAIVRARRCGELAQQCGAHFISSRADYLTADSVPANFVGRCFEVVTVLPWQRKEVLRYLRTNGIVRASVARRDFPFAPEQLQKLLGLEHDERTMLLCTTTDKGERIVIHGRRILER